MMKEPLILDAAFQEILQQLEQTGDHYFITGRAGTGKSTLLQLFRRTTHKKVVILSPTGISALNVQGQTIHSFFQFAPKLLQTKDLFLIRRLVPLLKGVDAIIIDEISMVRADVMDAIEYSLRLHRNNSMPFGGVQLILFGDMFQLPPVLSTDEEKLYFREHYASPYFFDAQALKGLSGWHLIELTRVYRQTERNFIRLLDDLRHRDLDYEGLEALNERYIPDAIVQSPYLTLCSTNAAAQAINATQLQSIDQPSVYFTAEVKGDFSARLYPTEIKLELKEGAQVMLIRNDPEKRFVNGTLATISSLREDEIIVAVAPEEGEEKSFTVPKMTWEINRYRFDEGVQSQLQSEVIGSFTQYPLRLAWAVTIHKSQGQTFDRVVIDLGRGAFEHGQTYVALSRCRTLGGIFLKKPLTPRDILVDERIVDFYQQIRN